jgi:glycopeptide antibiotics resistance protein
MNNKQTNLVNSESVVALYFFSEGKGSVVRNQVDSATNLLIPKRFFTLHELFLEPFWSEFHWRRWSYWKDVAINVAGFIPLGFFFCAYFSLVRSFERSTAVTIAVGFLVSLAIEVLQAFLPTRDSGTTDLITNTFGTFLGAVLFVRSVRRKWFVRSGISILPYIPREK